MSHTKVCYKSQSDEWTIVSRNATAATTKAMLKAKAPIYYRMYNGFYISYLLLSH